MSAPRDDRVDEEDKQILTQPRAMARLDQSSPTWKDESPDKAHAGYIQLRKNTNGLLLADILPMLKQMKI